jgi:hypothetical protein
MNRQVLFDRWTKLTEKDASANLEVKYICKYVKGAYIIHFKTCKVHSFNILKHKQLQRTPYEDTIARNSTNIGPKTHRDSAIFNVAVWVQSGPIKSYFTVLTTQNQSQRLSYASVTKTSTSSKTTRKQMVR